MEKLLSSSPAQTLGASFALLLVTLFWGLTFPLIALSLHHISPYNFVVYRFIIAAVLCFFWFRSRVFTKKISLIGHGLVLGLLNGIAYTLQTMGMQYIDAGQAAFLTSSSVVFVPLLSLIFYREYPSRLNILLVLFCLLGIYILTGASFSALSRGDWLVGGCAVAIAFSIVYIKKISEKYTEYAALTFYQIAFTSLLPLGFMEKPVITLLHMDMATLGALLFCAVFATVIALYLQMKYQRYVSATHAAIVFSLEPVFACLFAYLLLGEGINRNMWIGGSIIIASVVLNDMGDVFNLKTSIKSKGS